MRNSKYGSKLENIYKENSKNKKNNGANVFRINKNFKKNR